MKLDNFEAITKKILLLSPPIQFFETNRGKEDQPVSWQTLALAVVDSWEIGNETIESKFGSCRPNC